MAKFDIIPNIIINRFKTSSLKVTLTNKTKVEKKMPSSEAKLEAIIREQIEKALAAKLTELMALKREKAVLLKEEKIKSKEELEVEAAMERIQCEEALEKGESR